MVMGDLIRAMIWEKKQQIYQPKNLTKAINERVKAKKWIQKQKKPV